MEEKKEQGREQKEGREKFKQAMIEAAIRKAELLIQKYEGNRK